MRKHKLFDIGEIMRFMSFLYKFLLFGGIVFTISGFFIQPRSQSPVFFIIGGVFIILSAIWSYFIISAPAKAAQKKREQMIKEHGETEYNQKKLSALRGLDKYHEMDEAEAVAYLKGLEAMRTLGMAIEQSVYQEKEKDWAIMGGIADGIAGPFAGAATAMDAMQDNLRIRAENEARKEWGRQQNLYLHNLAAEAATKTPHALSMDKLKKRFRADFWKKPSDFLKMLEFKTEKISPDPDCNAVTVEASWERKEDICIDGTVRAMLYDDEDMYLGCAYLVFPKVGTAAKYGTLSGVCLNPASQNVAYVKYEAVSLWELAHAGSPENHSECNTEEEENILNQREEQLKEEYQSSIEKYTAIKEAEHKASKKRHIKNNITFFAILTAIAAIVAGIIFAVNSVKEGHLDSIAEEYESIIVDALDGAYEDYDNITDVKYSVESVKKVKSMSGYYTASIKVEITTPGDGSGLFLSDLLDEITDNLPEEFVTSNNKTVEFYNRDATDDYYCEEMIYIYINGELEYQPQKIK